VKPYLISLAAGVLVGVLYSLMRLQAPTPPLIGLLGLLGMLLGQQIIPVATKLIVHEANPVSSRREAPVIGPADARMHAAGERTPAARNLD